MEPWWNEVKELAAPWADFKEVGGVLSGILGLLAAIITLAASLVGRAVVFIEAPGAGGVQPRPPIRLSLKSILKGWFSTLVWSVVVFGLAGVVLGILAVNQVQAELPRQQQPFRLEVNGIATHETVDNQRRYAEAFNNLLFMPGVQVVLLVLLGCVYVRGAYVAACSAKTTTMMKLTHGLIAIASFEIASVLFVQHFFPGMVEVSKPPLVAQWEFPAIVLGCILGAVMGSED